MQVRSTHTRGLLLAGSESRSQAGLRAVPILRQEAELSSSPSLSDSQTILRLSARCWLRLGEGLKLLFDIFASRAQAYPTNTKNDLRSSADITNTKKLRRLAADLLTLPSSP